ncbi:MAG: hypothetical protein LUE99_00335 [Bacteroides sp.]|nr:hypothetical protein [Bacteroides sp.]
MGMYIFDNHAVSTFMPFSTDNIQPYEPAPDAHAPIDDSDDYYEEEEEDEEEYNTYLEREGGYNPGFINDGIIGTEETEDTEHGDIDSITSALTYFRDVIGMDYSFPTFCYPILSYRQPANIYDKGFGGKAYDEIVRLLWNNRVGITFNALLDMYSHIILEQFPKEIYHSRGYDEIVHQLIVSYDYLSAHPENFNEIYNIMRNTSIREEASFYDAYDKYAEMMKDYISEEILISPESSLDDCRTVWVYSFWARRHHEGCDKTVYEGLLKLQEIYQ